MKTARTYGDHLPGAMALSVGAALWIAACGGGGVTDGNLDPGTKPDTTTNPGGPPTVQRASITAQVRVDASDAALASAVGLTTGGLTVRLARSGSSEASRFGVTDPTGRVTFDALLEGSYQVTVERRLSDTEAARLPTGEQDATLFAAGAQHSLVPPGNQLADLALVATRRGSVVFSELFVMNTEAGTNLGYGFGTYVEVYNNSDTTVYLDGMLLARTPLPLHYGFSQYPCDQVNTAVRLDSTGIAVSLIHGFPGSGREFPIRAGEAKVIAVDAMDHHAASPTTGQLDLSQAHFEQYGSDADIDNPFVPDMVRVLAGTGAFGRGYPNANTPQAYVLALPTAFATLRPVRMTLTTGADGGGGSFEAYMIPRERIVDVLGLDSTPAEIALSVQRGVLRCNPWLSPVFERSQANMADFRLRKAISRKSLGHTADGREILQRTRTSARDFEYAEPLKRSLQK